MELKKITHSRKNIENSYLKAVSTKGMEEAVATLYSVINSDTNPEVATSWIARYIRKQSRIVASNTQIDFDTVLELVKQQFFVNALHSLNKDEAFLKSSIELSGVYVQSVLFSDLAKELESIKGQAFINEDVLNDTETEITVKATKKELAEDIVDELFNRKDQKEFVLSVITIGKDKTKEKYGYSEKRFNERLGKAEATLKNVYESGDASYIKSLFGEIIETSVYDTEAEMTEDDVLAEMYQNTTHQQSFYF